jgi:hypothetical protein
MALFRFVEVSGDLEGYRLLGLEEPITDSLEAPHLFLTPRLWNIMF